MTSAREPAPSRHVVLISIDGMRPDYYTHADSYHLKIPSLRSLMQRGRYAEGVVGVWPTVTYPAHTTLVTGARPGRHGVAANRPFDPTYRNRDGWNWYSESIKADTLWDAAHRVGKTTAAVFWPVSVGAHIDDNFPQIWRAENDEDDKLLRALASPGLAATFEHEYHALPAEQRTDHERGDAAEFLVRERRRDLTLVYFTDLDDAQHAHGPGSVEALATLERIDAEVGRVLKALDTAGDTARTAVVVVSDHGFVPINTTVRLGNLLRSAGLIDVSQGTVVRWRAGVLAAGGMAGIYLQDPSDTAVKEKVWVALAAAARDPKLGIKRVLDHDAMDHVSGFPGASFAVEALPGFELSASLTDPMVGPSHDRGGHGYSPDVPEMAASFIIAGSGIAPGPPLGSISMLSIGPTVARLLGVTLKDREAEPVPGLLRPETDP